MVRTAGAGSGFLALNIDGPSKVAVSCKEVDEGYEFSYTPFSSGKYLIAIKYGNINIAGSPYVAEITGINLNIDYIFILLFLMMFDYNIPPVYIFTYFCSICFSFLKERFIF